VEDTARAVVLATKLPKAKTRVFTTGADYRFLQEAADYIRKLLPDAKITFSIHPNMPLGKLNFPRYNVEKIKGKVGYEWKISMEEGIKKL